MKIISLRPRSVYFIIFLVCLIGCGTSRPILYPNHHLEAVGKDVAEYDIKTCLDLANSQVGSGQTGRKVAGEGLTSSIVGAVTGTAIGAVTGNVGRGAAIGAAGGGASGITQGALSAREPDAVYKSYVEACLRERGYDPIGWR